MQKLDHYTATRPNQMLAASATAYVAGAAICSLSVALNPSLPVLLVGGSVMLIARKILLRCQDCSQTFHATEDEMTLALRRSVLETQSLWTITRGDAVLAITWIAASILALYLVQTPETLAKIVQTR